MHATTSPKAMDLKPAALALVAAAVFAGGIILGSAVDLQITSAPAAAVVGDHSNDVREGFRAQSRASVDTYDARENFRAQSDVTVDTSLQGKSGFPSTRTPSGVSSHDQARGAAGWWASAPVAPATEVEPFDRIGGGYR